MLWNSDIEWYVTVRLSDFLLLSRVRLLGGRQSSCHGTDMGRYAHSIWPAV
jgi:hypothetical protein